MRPLHQDKPFSYERIDKPIVILLRDNKFYRQSTSTFIRLFNNVTDCLDFSKIKESDRIYAFHDESEIAAGFEERCLEKHRHIIDKKTHSETENFEAIRRELKAGNYVGWYWDNCKYINKLSESSEQIKVFRCRDGNTSGHWGAGSSYPKREKEFFVFDNEYEFWSWAHSQSPRG